MRSPSSILIQLAAYSVFAAAVGYFSAAPAYTHHDPGLSLIKLSFSHAAERKEVCRKLTPKELAALAANMRNALDCTRERLEVLVELSLDGQLLYRASLPPSGLARDGASTAYARFTVAPGRHRLSARLRDRRDTTGFDYQHEANIELSPGQNFVVDFRADLGGFKFL